MPSAKKVQLKLDGSPLDLHPLPPMVSRILRFLDTLPDNEVVTSSFLVNSLSISRASLEKAAPHSGLEQYRAKHANKNYWGNRCAIAEFRRQQKETEE